MGGRDRSAYEYTVALDPLLQVVNDGLLGQLGQEDHVVDPNMLDVDVRLPMEDHGRLGRGWASSLNRHVDEETITNKRDK